MDQSQMPGGTERYFEESFGKCQKKSVDTCLCEENVDWDKLVEDVFIEEIEKLAKTMRNK